MSRRPFVGSSATSPRRRSPPTQSSGTGTTPSPPTWSGAWATSACSASPSRRSTRRWRRPDAALHRDRGDRSRRPVDGHHPQGGGRAGRHADPRFGTEEQKQQWLPDLCAGRALAAFGLTEPDAGSDAGAGRATARIDGESSTTADVDTSSGEWVLNGEKSFITNSGTEMTSLVTVTARTGPGEISTIIVPSGTPGFEVQPAYRKMGWHASDTHGLIFTDCRVPAANLLGEPGRGIAQFLEILDEGRILIAALALGCVEACLDHSLRYAKERNTFGRPIGANQGLAFQLADLSVMAETARLLDVPRRRDVRRRSPVQAAGGHGQAVHLRVGGPPPASPRRSSGGTGSWTRRP